ncbi:MAG: protein kinase [Clostridia bacterium]|nr:protein kinase [Clostridia bacterium]
MFCDKCGSAIKDEDMFCPTCGAKQTDKNTEEKVAQSIAMPVSSINDIEEQNEVIKKIWPDWELIEKIGEGSFGKVYRAKREEVGNITSYSAIKIIRIPQNSSEIDSVKSEVGLDEQSTTAYFKGFVDDCVNEIKMMESLKGTQNIVSVEDYKVVPHENEIGWTIYIRMELLTSFVAHTKDKVLSEKEVIKLGIDMCNALEFCAKCNVMHRDIKPENIFISSFGIYKLGDFGIARKLEKSTTGMSKKGTYNYMAPEIYNGKTSYDFKSDIYSLGIVLYKLLNGNRFPLVDPRSSNITYQQMQDAFDKRMQGAVLPKPLNASDALSNVILTACAFNPEDRFSNASALKMALTNVQNGTADKVVNPPRNNPAKNDGTIGVINRKSPQNKQPVKVNPIPNQGSVKKFDTTPVTPKQEKLKKVKKEKKMSKGKKALAIILSILIVLVVAAGGLGIAYLMSDEQKIVRALDKEKYDEALAIYNSSFDGDASGLLEWSIESRLEKIKEDFASGSVEYEVANMEISTIEKMGIGGITTAVKSAKDYVSKLNTSRTAFNTAETMYSKGDYAGAIANYKKVVEDDADYETAKSKLATTIEKYREEVLANATAFVKEGSYAKAITELDIALENVPNDSKITEQLNVYKSDYAAQTKDEALSTASKAVESKDYVGAIKAIQVALESNSEDTELLTALKEHSDSYVDVIVKNVDALTSKKNYTEAISVLNDAIEILPENTVLKDKLNTVEANRPVSLSTLTPINGGWTWNEGTPTDPFEITYTNVSNFVIFDGSDKHEYYSEYRLYGKYITLSGSLVSHMDINETGVSQVQIYADEKLVYTSPDIERKTDVIDFSANISGADYVKVVVVTDNKDYWDNDQCLIMMNCQLWTE